MLKYICNSVQAMRDCTYLIPTPFLFKYELVTNIHALGQERKCTYRVILVFKVCRIMLSQKLLKLVPYIIYVQEKVILFIALNKFRSVELGLYAYF